MIAISQQHPRWIAAILALFILSMVGLLATHRVIAEEKGHLSSDIKDYVANKLDDFSATLKVLQYDEKAGTKINRDFGTIYQLKGDIKVRYKEENKLRLDAHLKTIDVTFIVNGTKQHVHSSLINSTQDIGNTPGKRKTLLDVGLISTGYLSYSNAEFKGDSNINGLPFLDQSAARNRVRQTLLRASDSPLATTADLLRPADTGDADDPQQLLRSSNDGETL